MKLPLEMLIDYMGYLEPELRLKHRDMWVDGIKLMPEDGHLNPNYVYFAPYKGEFCGAEGAPIAFVCPKEISCGPDAGNCIILHTDMPLASVFNEMLGLQNLILSWSQEMELSVSRREGVQRLLDISGRVFGNPIAISTGNFRTIAATWEFETDNQMFWELIELGFLTQETLMRLKTKGYFSAEQLNGELVVLDVEGADNYKITLSAILSAEGAAFLVMMLCSNTKLSRGLLQIYDVFIEKLRYYLQPEAAKGDYMKAQFESLLLDIIEGKTVSRREIVERGRAFPPAYTTEYQTVLIDHESNSPMYLDHAMANLSAVFPNVRQLRLESCVILHPDFSGSQSRKINFFTSLEDYLLTSHAYAGVSDPASGIFSLRESYRQADEALLLGRQLMLSGVSEQMLKSDNRKSRIFTFSRYHLYSMLAGKEKDIGILEQIRQYDLERHTDYYRILFVFLSLERSFTKAAQILHMHRNNVIYHTKRMCEIFSLDLDDPNQRLRLLLLYRLGDLLSNRLS